MLFVTALYGTRKKYGNKNSKTILSSTLCDYDNTIQGVRKKYTGCPEKVPSFIEFLISFLLRFQLTLLVPDVESILHIKTRSCESETTSE